MGLSCSNLSKTVFDPFLNLLFPRICLVCSIRITDTDPFLCPKCRSQIIPESECNCPVCGALNTVNEQECRYCSNEKADFDSCFSLIHYNDAARILIHQMKYNEMTKIASYLAQLAVTHLQSRNPFRDVDYVCPVPLHPTKLRERGYNQAALIARHVADHFGWQYQPHLITRTRFTESQAELSPEKRKLNVDRAFSVDRKSTVKDSNILIVDDVFTTGATVNAISRVLRKSKANRIYVFTVARA